MTTDPLYNIRPVSDLRNNFAEISRIVHETSEPIFLTKNGSIGLDNPTASEKLVAEMIEAAEKIREMPYLCLSYTPIRTLKHDYRKLLIKNYIMFYWVNEQPAQKITVARVVYSKSNYERFI